ncbi:tyrosine-type recombinase/integrase [Streptomyces asoensis]|uniref:site-specific integrase n=1 Tax=Streptomyces asoensis TaxID=249586 RepID=UPI0016731A7F|nr:site-specific integrase [Streptomyces asoensis]GGQ66955.1 hypothetical protein GCM10010496_33130 [Streptomyces asoensis]
MHVRRRENENGAWSKSRHTWVAPLDFLVVSALDLYYEERYRLLGSGGSDFLLMNLFRAPLGEPVSPEAIGELLERLSGRAGLDRRVGAHMARRAFASNVADAGGTPDEVAAVLGQRRYARRVLLRFRTLGLTAPGRLLAGMPVDFAILPEDMPDEPEDTEAGRDLPDEVMRALCAHLDELETMSSTEIRVATELLIDTGRRPDEINTLPLNCLEQDPDGSDILVYDSHKAYRLGRRLPIGTETAATIRRQQQRVRARFPAVDPARLRLLPRPKVNPEGTKPLAEISSYHRAWVKSLPDLLVPVVVSADDARLTQLVPFDKTRIFPYAYRHCYAQRHADAGAPSTFSRN